jgi:flavin reductase (DIM6/NTAB) family NADH-FMN oxidoreductase RutF
MKTEHKPSTSIVPCPVVLLSVRGKERPNIITLSWTGNVSSVPPTIVVGIRPNRYSHEMVKTAGEFVVNIPGKNLIDTAVFCGTKSGRDYDKFKECGLAQVPASKVNAPMIKECPINLECRTKDVVNVGSHDLFIAEVLAVHLDDAVCDSTGKLDPSKADLFVYIPTTGEYWELGQKLK